MTGPMIAFTSLWALVFVGWLADETAPVRRRNRARREARASLKAAK